jgi:hypothetical protein
MPRLQINVESLDFLGIMANRNFAFKIIHRQTMTMTITDGRPVPG